MTLLDCRISLTFEKLFIPVLDMPECVLDILYDNQHYRFQYPQEVPHIMPLQEPFTREKNLMLLTLLLKTGKKYRKIARGEINFYKKYFLNEKLNVDKWVYLELYQTQLEQMGHSTNILKAVSNTGKIFMRAQLLDPLLEDKNGQNLISSHKPKGIFDNLSIYTATTHASAMTQILKNNLKNLPNIKDKAQANKTEKFRSVTEHGNEFLRNLKNKKNVIEELYEDIEDEEGPKKPTVEEFDDGLSDVSISIIDGTEENHIEIDKMNIDIDSLVDKIKNIYENKIDEILPKDPVELKKFIKTFSTQILNIGENYTQNLLTLNDINKRIKFQAKDYYERYKENKKTFKKERRDLKNKNKLLEYEATNNIEENIKIGKNLEDVKNELNFFKHKIGVKDENLNRDDDLLLMVDILNSVKHSEDLTLGLDDTQKASLVEILGKYDEGAGDKKNLLSNGERDVNEDFNDNIGKDENLADIIIGKIEDIVNENFSNKKIINIIIDQVTDDTFKFNDKTAELYIENDVLRIKEKGYNSFEEWIVYHFGLEKINNNGSTTNGSSQNVNNVKKGSQISTTSNKTPMQQMLDKKLAEKKAMLSGNNNSNSMRNKTPNKR